MNRIAQLFTRRYRYNDLSVSIREHLEEKIEDLVDSGMSRAQAERAARREFGNVTLIQERSREVWQWPVEIILSDLKLTLRRLRKAPGFAATVILTLAIGIGANTAVFSVVNSVLLKPLPYPDAGLTQLMKSLLFGVSPINPVTYFAISFVLASSTVLASYLPARRAASIDPVEALRAE